MNGERVHVNINSKFLFSHFAHGLLSSVLYIRQLWLLSFNEQKYQVIKTYSTRKMVPITGRARTFLLFSEFSTKK